MTTTTLWRPTGPTELKLIEESRWASFPSRLPEQPLFYPVCNQSYAEQIARDWNCKPDHPGYVVKFDVDSKFLERYPIQTVGSRDHQELWVPAEELEEFNQNIVGKIEVVARFDHAE